MTPAEPAPIDWPMPNAAPQPACFPLEALMEGDELAVAELRDLVRRRLHTAFRARRDISDADLDDFTQDACVRILQSLDSFRGDAKFATWATTVAVRVALTALRRRRWTVRSVDERLDAFARGRFEPTGAHESERKELFAALRHAIEHDLTARQRQVMLGELAGVPQVLIAERLGSTLNAIYKMSHDARLKLKSALIERGYSAASVRETIDGASKGGS